MRQVAPQMGHGPFMTQHGQRFIIALLGCCSSCCSASASCSRCSRASDAKAAQHAEPETAAQPATSEPAPAPAPQIRDVTVERPVGGEGRGTDDRGDPGTRDRGRRRAAGPRRGGAAHRVRPSRSLPYAKHRSVVPRRAPWRVRSPRRSSLLRQPRRPPPRPKPDNCSPPYYFEGQKKVFKPNCL